MRRSDLLLWLGRTWEWEWVPRENPFFDRLASDELFLDEAVDAFFGHAGIPKAFWVNDQDGAPMAYSEAVGFGAKAGAGAGRQGDLTVFEDGLEFTPSGVADFLRAAGIADAEKDVADEVADFEFGGDRVQWVHIQFADGWS